MSAPSSRVSHQCDAGRAVVSGTRCTTVGDQALLKQPLLALFCSIKCPGELILKLFDFAKELRDKGAGVISGFHAPMDQECFDILLRGEGPVVWCPARSIEKMKLKNQHKKAVEEGRLLILSPFPAKQNRISAKLAEERNRLVAALAERVFVAYANPGGKTEALCREIVVTGKPLLTFESRHTENLLALGAQVLTEDEIAIATTANG